MVRHTRVVEFATVRLIEKAKNPKQKLHKEMLLKKKPTATISLTENSNLLRQV